MHSTLKPVVHYTGDSLDTVQLTVTYDTPLSCWFYIRRYRVVNYFPYSSIQCDWLDYFLTFLYIFSQ